MTTIKKNEFKQTTEIQKNGESVLKVARQLHLHKNPTTEERDEEATKADQLKHDSIQFRHRRRVSLVEDHESGATQSEHEA